MAQKRSRIFDGRTNIEVFTRWIVSGNEIEAAIVLVVNAWCIHETSGTRRLKGFRQLTNFKPAKVRRHCDQSVGFEEFDHLGFAALVSLQKGFLVFWDVLAAR